MKISEIYERQLNTYAELWQVSYWTLDRAEREFEGSYFQLVSSLIFTAFALEAYLNHIGNNIFSCWDDLEYLPPINKLNLVTEKLGIKTDYSRRPFQTIKRLFKFRNNIAHGKSKKLRYENIIITNNLNDLNNDWESPRSEWEQYCTLDNAKKARKDTEDIIKNIHQQGNFQERLFFLGSSSREGTILSKDNSQ